LILAPRNLKGKSGRGTVRGEKKKKKKNKKSFFYFFFGGEKGFFFYGDFCFFPRGRGWGPCFFFTSSFLWGQTPVFFFFFWPQRGFFGFVFFPPHPAPKKAKLFSQKRVKKPSGGRGGGLSFFSFPPGGFPPGKRLGVPLIFFCFKKKKNRPPPGFWGTKNPKKKKAPKRTFPLYGGPGNGGLILSPRCNMHGFFSLGPRWGAGMHILYFFRGLCPGGVRVARLVSPEGSFLLSCSHFSQGGGTRGGGGRNLRFAGPLPARPAPFAVAAGGGRGTPPTQKGGPRGGRVVR